MSWGRALGTLGACALVLGGVHVLREATESRHELQPPGSRLRVVVEARSHRAEGARALDELTEAHVWFCRLEIASDLVGDLERVPREPGRYALVLQPSLDDTDRRQYEGCLEDWTLDHHLLRVVSMTEDQGTEGA